MVRKTIAKKFLRAAVLACIATLFGWAAALAGVPGEVPELSWCAGTQDCLAWSPVAGAEGYVVYRGGLAGVQGLVGGQADACVHGTFVGPTSGATVDDPPPAGGRWYLVAATNAAGEGSTGSASDGPRVVGAAGSCDGAAEGGLTLNEIDYDQPGADTAEFIEITNAGPVDLALTGVALIFVNGSSQSEYGRVDLSAAGSLATGGYLVVGAAGVLAGLPAGVTGLALPASLQNGAPDGVALFDTVSGALLDALSYEGEIRAAAFAGVAGTFDLVEGRAATAADTGDGALARVPDGRDTDDADGDWVLVPTPTPGRANPTQ